LCSQYVGKISYRSLLALPWPPSLYGAYTPTRCFKILSEEGKVGNQALDVPLLMGRDCCELQKADRYRQTTVGSWNNVEALECSWKGHLQERDKVVAVLVVVAAALAKILPRNHLWVKVKEDQFYRFPSLIRTLLPNLFLHLPDGYC
jgi:hypothetical protein